MKTKNRRSAILKHKNKTRKIYGGDIDKHNIFRKILSIGYELETLSLAKFTLITTDNEDEPILLNTDTNSKDFEKMMKLQNGNSGEDGEDEDDEDDYDYYANRLEETLEIDAYTTESLNKQTKQTRTAKTTKSVKEVKLVKEEDATFLVANDMAVTSFTKYLNNFCNINDGTNKTNHNTAANTTNTHNTKTEGDLIDKNDLYTFETDDNDKKYKLNFETWSKKDCGMFSDVEWIMTYYKPKQNKNIILSTFVNVAKNLIFHLNQLKKQKGRLIMNFSEDDKEIMKKSEIRNLYHLPNTNLYYLQTHLIDKQLDIIGNLDFNIVPNETVNTELSFVISVDDFESSYQKTKYPSAREINVIPRIDNKIMGSFLFSFSL
jgi:hypothetical protein